MRWILAAGNVAMFLALWWSVRPEREWFAPLGQYTATPRRLAIGVNAPAYLLSGIVTDSLGYNPYERDVLPAFLYAMIPAVGLVWFLTGRWFDRRRGLLPRKPKGYARLRLVGIGVLILMQVLLLYRCYYFLTGGIAGWHGETPVYAAYTYGLAGWLSLWLVMAFLSWVDSRSTQSAR